LISIGKIAEKGLTLVFDSVGCRVHKGKVIEPPNPTLITRKSGTLYEGESKEVSMNTKEIALKTDEWLWHRRMGHPSLHMLKLTKSAVSGITSLPPDCTCCMCIEGKMTRKPFPNGGSTRAEGKLDLIHTDLYGPVTPTSWSGLRYALTLSDDYSKKVFVYFLRTKDEAVLKFLEFKAMVELQSGCKLKKIRSDNAKELIQGNFGCYLREHGIINQTTRTEWNLGEDESHFS